MHRHRLDTTDPEIDLTIPRLKQRLVMIKLQIAQPGKMIPREPTKKEVGFLHARVAGLIDQSTDPRVTGFGHWVWFPDLVQNAPDTSGVGNMARFGDKAMVFAVSARFDDGYFVPTPTLPGRAFGFCAGAAFL